MKAEEILKIEKCGDLFTNDIDIKIFQSYIIQI